ncbi:hypothetical protein MJN47_30505, partial [Salmonella enterica subsp. enterica serovar Lubbock]|nr:hypothetical protein [Salmonella enterica subsp. enterica serovar Lubbock]
SGSELSLYDIAPVTPGVAVDLSHIPTAVKIKGFSGEDATPALAQLVNAIEKRNEAGLARLTHASQRGQIGLVILGILALCSLSF